jgi:hypothetical protein
MINTLLRSSCTQASLFDFATTKCKMESTPKSTTSIKASSAAIFQQSALSFGCQTAQKRPRELASHIVGKCVRVHEVYHRFVRRAKVIYFRLCVFFLRNFLFLVFVYYYPPVFHTIASLFNIKPVRALLHNKFGIPTPVTSFMTVLLLNIEIYNS